jgi:hypothetical protein
MAVQQLEAAAEASTMYGTTTVQLDLVDRLSNRFDAKLGISA